MTRAELAEMVNAQVFRATGGGRVTSVDANHIGKWERGAISWPSQPYRAALRVILDVSTDRELGFVRRARSRPDDGDDVNRKRFLKVALGTGAGMVVPGRPFAPDDEHELRTALSGPSVHYRRIEQTVSSARLGPAVDAHLDLARKMVGERLTTASGYAMLAEIAGLAAWLAIDRGDQPGARRRYLEAIRHAQRAHHHLLVPYMVASLGQFAVEAGDTRQGLQLFRRAHTEFDDATPDSARAWLASLQAVGYAALGDRKATYKAIRSAETYANRQHGEPTWPWVFTFDRTKAARYEATALARLGDARAAIDTFNVVIPLITSPKARALAQIDHAYALTRANRVSDGCALAVEALCVGREYESERVASGVRTLRRKLPPSSTEQRTLDAELNTLYRPDDL